MALQHKYRLVLMEALLLQSKVVLLVCSLVHFVNEDAIWPIYYIWKVYLELL